MRTIVPTPLHRRVIHLSLRHPLLIPPDPLLPLLLPLHPRFLRTRMVDQMDRIVRRRVRRISVVVGGGGAEDGGGGEGGLGFEAERGGELGGGLFGGEGAAADRVGDVEAGLLGEKGRVSGCSGRWKSVDEKRLGSEGEVWGRRMLDEEARVTHLPSASGHVVSGG